MGVGQRPFAESITIEACYGANFQPRFAVSGFQIHNDVSGAREMRVRALNIAVALIAAATAIGVGPARAADCGESADGFNEWLASFKEVAVRNGVSQQAVDSALNGHSTDRWSPAAAVRIAAVSEGGSCFRCSVSRAVYV